MRLARLVGLVTAGAVALAIAAVPAPAAAASAEEVNAVVTTAPKVPAAPKPTTTTVPTTAGASEWMALALEVTRTWERATG